MKEIKKPSYRYCKNCDKDIIPIVKIFNTNICPRCAKIISSDKEWKQS